MCNLQRAEFDLIKNMWNIILLIKDYLTVFESQGGQSQTSKSSLGATDRLKCLRIFSESHTECLVSLSNLPHHQKAGQLQVLTLRAGRCKQHATIFIQTCTLDLLVALLRLGKYYYHFDFWLEQGKRETKVPLWWEQSNTLAIKLSFECSMFHLLTPLEIV